MSKLRYKLGQKFMAVKLWPSFKNDPNSQIGQIWEIQRLRGKGKSLDMTLVHSVDDDAFWGMDEEFLKKTFISSKSKLAKLLYT
jgi:hypothetical protein